MESPTEDAVTPVTPFFPHDNSQLIDYSEPPANDPPTPKDSRLAYRGIVFACLMISLPALLLLIVAAILVYQSYSSYLTSPSRLKKFDCGTRPEHQACTINDSGSSTFLENGLEALAALEL